MEPPGVDEPPPIAFVKQYKEKNGGKDPTVKDFDNFHEDGTRRVFQLVGTIISIWVGYTGV